MRESRPAQGSIRAFGKVLPPAGIGTFPRWYSADLLPSLGCWDLVKRIVKKVVLHPECITLASTGKQTHQN